MRAHQFIEKYFWIFLIFGIVTGLIFPVNNDFLEVLIKPFLMIMLFTVFLKADIIQVFHRMKRAWQIIVTQLVPTWREENHYRASSIEYR
jgi:ACR3 family arsenite efflux pump ArsB